MNIDYEIFTKTGDRDKNDDSAIGLNQPGRYLFALADGMGAYDSGELASSLVCETVRIGFETIDIDSFDYFDCIYENCQERLQILSDKEAGKKLGTTLNLTLIDTDKSLIRWNHIGDSRTYYFQDKSLKKRTYDHSLAQLRVDVSDIEESQLRHDSGRNCLTKSLVSGADGIPVMYEEETDITLSDKQELLMCTDGFWELIDDEVMESLLKQSRSPKEWINLMFEYIDVNSGEVGRDNMTVIAIWMQ